MRRLGKRHFFRRGIVILLVLWCGACASQQARYAAGQHVSSPYDRPSEVDLEPVRLVGSSRYRQPHMAAYYQYDQTETDFTTPLSSSPRSGK